MPDLSLSTNLKALNVEVKNPRSRLMLEDRHFLCLEIPDIRVNLYFDLRLMALKLT